MRNKECGIPFAKFYESFSEILRSHQNVDDRGNGRFNHSLRFGVVDDDITVGIHDDLGADVILTILLLSSRQILAYTSYPRLRHGLLSLRSVVSCRHVYTMSNFTNHFRKFYVPIKTLTTVETVGLITAYGLALSTDNDITVGIYEDLGADVILTILVLSSRQILATFLLPETASRVTLASLGSVLQTRTHHVEFTNHFRKFYVPIKTKIGRV